MNNAAQVLGLAVLIAGLGAGLAALVVLCDALLPALVRRARHYVQSRSRVSFAIGLVNFLFLGLLAAVLGEAGEGAGLLAVLLLTVLLSLAAIGLAAVAGLVGTRISPAGSRWPELVVGAVTLELAALVPLVGWFVVAGLAVLTGLGATVMALVGRGASESVGATDVAA
jgi:hypothetical protein